MPCNSIRKKHLLYFKIYHAIKKLYKNQIKQVNVLDIPEEGELFKLIILQFNIIAQQGLISIVTLLNKKEYFIPHLIVRNMVEYALTSAYIEKNPIEGATKYATHGLVNQLKLINAAKKYSSSLDADVKEVLEREIHVIRELENIPIDHQKLPSIEQRAETAGLGDKYYMYRLLCLYSHPDSNSSNDYFNEIDGKIVVHKYNKDHSALILQTALEITNIFMSRVDDIYNLGLAEKYDNIAKRLKEMDNILRQPIN